MTNSKVIALDSINKAFGPVEVLKNLNLVIRPGEFISLVGPSGCGKSTLLRLIAGLDSPDSGHVKFDDQSVNHLLPSERSVAMVFQNYALYPHLTVLQNVTLPLQMAKMTLIQRLPILRKILPSAKKINLEIESLAMELIKSLELEALKDRKPAQISGGQKQRVALARAMVRRPTVFLMDEPLSNLDAQLRVYLREELVELHKKLGITFIYVTHDQSEAMTMSDRIVVMKAGQLLQIGTPTDLYSNPNSLQVAQFIGSPVINSFKKTKNKNLNDIFLKYHLFLENPLISYLAIRAEDCTLDLNELDSCDFLLSAKLKRIENHGSEYWAYLEGPIGTDIQFICKYSSSNTKPQLSEGNNIRFGFKLKQALFFDQSQKRIRTD